MLKRMFCFAVVLALASISYGVVIGDFEDGSFDHWRQSVSWPDLDPVDATFTHSRIGATLNDKSLRVKNQPGGQATMAIKLQYLVEECLPEGAPGDNVGFDGYGAFFANDTISLDVTMPADEWTGGGWAQLEIISNSEKGGWVSLGAQGLSLGTNSLAYDYSGVVINPADPGGYNEFVVVTNRGGWETEGFTYFDNIQLTPEPATIALLGLGGLALLRKKR